MTDEEVRKYASPRPWKVRRAPWGGVLIMDATGEAIASMDEPAPEIALANAALMAEGANALSAPRRRCEKFATAYEAIKAWEGGLDTAEDIVRMVTWLLGKAE